MFKGYLFIAIGAWFLFDNLGFLPGLSVSQYWPIILIAIGVWIVGKKEGHWCEHGKYGKCDRCVRGEMNQ
jgi:hypothetical protein